MRRAAYSMVELIVVMGIVVVLASLLFPALASTKSRAGETTCMSNLKQLGMAMLMYKEDEGEFPWSNGSAFERYLGNAKLRCVNVKNPYAFNLSVYRNLVMFGSPLKDERSRAWEEELRRCFELRGPQYPMVIDMNHLPSIMRPDDQLYGIALAYRVSGAVERIPKSRVAEIGLAMGGIGSAKGLPCKPIGEYANL